jgi:hypothetical protein
MATNHPNADFWRQLFAALTGDATNDAAVVREFCDLHGVTPAQVMEKMHAQGASKNQQQEQSRALSIPRYLKFADVYEAGP